MNAAYVHIVFNHFPILLIPFAAIVVALAMRTGHQPTLKFSLILLVFAAATSIPTYYSGEGAEDIVEKVVGVSHDSIEEHEDAGYFAFISSLIVGVSALVALFVSGNKKKWALRLTLFLALWSTTVLARTAYLGGKIIHHEVHTPSEATPSTE